MTIGLHHEAVDWVGRVEAFRGGYCALIALAVLVQLPAHAQWVKWKGDDRWLPEIVGWIPLPRLNVTAFVALGIAFAAGLLAVAAPAIASWWLLIVATFCALWYFAQVIDIPAVRRKPNSVPIILLLLAAAHFAPAADAEKIAWVCLLVVKVVIAQIYLSSAIVKLQKSGVEWGSGNSLQVTLLRYHLRNGSRLGLWMARRPGACRLASMLVLVFELTFWLVIPFPVLAWAYIPLGIIFHLGTATMMRIHYWIYVMPAYLVFVLG